MFRNIVQHSYKFAFLRVITVSDQNSNAYATQTRLFQQRFIFTRNNYFVLKYYSRRHPSPAEVLNFRSHKRSRHVLFVRHCRFIIITLTPHGSRRQTTIVYYVRSNNRHSDVMICVMNFETTAVASPDVL